MRDLSELISEQLDGTLSPQDEAELERRLALDPEAAEVYQLLSGVKSSLDFEVEPPEALLRGVMDGVERENRRRRGLKRRFVGIAAGLAAAAVLAVAVIPAAVRGRDRGDVSPYSNESDRIREYRDDIDGSDSAVCCNPTGTSLPVIEDPEIYTSVEDWCASYRGVAWFDSLPEEIVSGAREYRFANGDLGYRLTAEQFASLLDAALRVEYPDPDGEDYMAVISGTER